MELGNPTSSMFNNGVSIAEPETAPRAPALPAPYAAPANAALPPGRIQHQRLQEVRDVKNGI